jgi:cytoskeletal protein CcmA (bactofilin family)
MSFIGSEVSITGNISAAGDIHLDGAVQGDIACAALTVGGSGHVKGNVLAQRATIAGAVEGAIVATELVIERSARILGDVSYESISIETGARVDGRLSQKAAPSGELKLVAAAGE